MLNKLQHFVDKLKYDDYLASLLHIYFNFIFQSKE